MIQFYSKSRVLLFIITILALVPWISFGLAQDMSIRNESTTSPSEVKVGAYINDIQTLNLREHSYAIDIYIWFRWKDPEIEPTESIEMVNPNELWGHVSERHYESPITLPSGELYQVLRVQGRFSHKFFFNNYPYDRQNLVVEFEDEVHEAHRLRYVPDDQPISMNPALTLPGFRLGKPLIRISDFKYPTAFGDTRRTEPHIYSRVAIEMPIHRPLIPSTLKMLLPVLCVVLGASLMLRLKVSYIDARLGIGITSLLTVVAIQLAANETMPNVDYLVLMDKIHLSAYAYVLLGLGVVLITARQMHAGTIDDPQRFQSRAFWVLSIGFSIAIAVLITYSMWQG